MDLRGRSLLTMTGLSKPEFLYLTRLAAYLREDKRRGVTGMRLTLAGKCMTFRTRAATSARNV